MRWLDRLSRLVFPPRASTQRWMFLTFSLFVGAAVVGVALYVLFMLGVQIDDAREQTLRRQAERVALLLDTAEADAERLRLAREISRLTDLRLTLAVPPGRVLTDARDGDEVSDARLLEQPEMATLADGRSRYAQRIDPATDARVHFVTLARDGYVLRVGQPEPPLSALLRKMQWTLVLGMVMALLLALVGSWIASEKVTRPLQTIRNSARNISDGKLDERIRVDTRAAEIQDLAKNLNRMSESFREKIDELERLARLQSEFIGNVSHEVRNPIFAISGYLEALGSPRLSDDLRRRYAEKGLLNLQRLSNLFNDLIEIARLEYREDLIKPSVFDLAELVEEAAEMLRPKAEEKGLHLIVENPHLMVQADRNRIRQVFVNLIDNAIAYSDEGTVRCRLQRRLEKVRVEVVDTGRGIPEDHLDRIFERFYRVDPDRSRKSGGTGLGLSIVKQILQAHGEAIHVESTVGRGTRFWFDLPYAGQPVEASAQAA
ncbi:MAG: ATP-binding protein [Rhodothermales bacterium]|nr:ATP-binding protein [Rhodothermales bacterium]